MRLHLAILVSFVLMSGSVMASHGFDGYYCSGVDSQGDWAVSFGEHPVGFHCTLVQHEILYDGGEMYALKKGHYVVNDLNEVRVNCQQSSFKLVDFGGYAIKRAKQKAEELEATHCLFSIREYP